MTLHAQLITMGSMIVSGFYLGIALETFRRFSMWWRNSIFFTYMFEICFWLSQTFILFYVLFKVNYGELRFYVFLAILLGFSMYVVLFKKVYIYLLELLIHIVSTIIKGVIFLLHVCIVRPLYWLFRVLSIIIQWIWTCMYSVIVFVINVLLLPVTLMIMVIIFILPHKCSEIYSQFSRRCSTIVNNYLLTIKNFFKKGGN